MKTAITLILGLGFILWSGNLKITLNPFSLSFESWRNMLGLIFLILSLTFFQMHHEKEGKEKALKIVNEVLEEQLTIIKEKDENN